MKKTALIRRKWILGGSALFLLYAGLHSGGILLRLCLLVAATGCFVFWSRNKQRLDGFVERSEVAEQVFEVAAPVSGTQAGLEPQAYFAKMPVRYPRPVYIHRGGFHLQRH
jgi:hypothetical protein